MSMAPSHPSRSSRNHRAEWLRALAFACAFAGVAAANSAQARQTDSSQPVLVKADNSVMDQDKGIATLTGHVSLDQGTMQIEGDKAIGHFDQNNQIQRAVVTGNPARFRQTLDDNSLVHGSASNIDYQVSENTVILTGNAVVVHEGQGDFHGAKLTYNTDTGSINGTGGVGGQVHMTLVPKPKSAKPSANTPATPAAPAKPASSAPAASAPAPASTSGTH